jgi:alkanesulfonate monooxygenase SsuD/methylene tetrahydromethanopterin reductase-like flavin-dependent oxidoreductase (luciferase family)
LTANGVDPAERILIFQERLALLEALWTGGSVSFESAHTVVRNIFIHPRPLQAPHPPIWFAGTEATAAMWAGQHGLNLAIGFAPTTRLFGATTAFRHGVAMYQAQRENDDEIRRGSIALMRHVIVGASDKDVRAGMLADLMRVGEIDQSATAANRADRKRVAREQLDRLIGDEVFIAGSPDTVVSAIVNARNQLGASLFLANLYAAGLDQERVRQTMTLLAGPVREGLEQRTTRI